MGMRFRAGAMGVPFMPIRSMLGSDVVKSAPRSQGDDLPVHRREAAARSGAQPDVALIHVQRCDAYGNAQIDGLQFMDIDLAMAANKVILTTERIVSNDQIRRAPDQTKIPFFAVDAVVELPFGCAPHECYGVYEPMMRAHGVLRRSREQGSGRLVCANISTGSSMGRNPGPISLISSALTKFSRPRARGNRSMTLKSTYTAGELLAILSARQLKDGQVVFAGVGIPLLAATLAQRLHCPGLTILFEGGVIGAFIEPGKLPPSTNDQRCTVPRQHGARQCRSAAAAAARLCRCRLHGRRADRPVRQSQQLVHRRSGQAESRDCRAPAAATTFPASPT